METKIKICGLTRPHDIAAAIEAGADYLGFVIACNSPRALSLSKAARLIEPIRGIAKIVVVTVNPDDKTLHDIFTNLGPDYLQLHGQESLKRVQDIRAMGKTGLIKAVPIATKVDLNDIASFAPLADMILLDAKPPKSSRQAGGHGQRFDWNIIKNLQCDVPLILAGGLSAQNIKTAKQTGISFFDVSSGVERQPGIKDPSKIHAFMKAAGK